MQKRQKNRWLIDALLFSGFLLAFFLDLTGLSMHQWLGVAVGAAAVFHLLSHWNWVQSVTTRFFGKTSNQARGYYLVDIAMLTGFAAIGITGLVISSWLNLPLEAYETWRQMHVILSILTLLVTLLKLGLHSRWIIIVARSILYRPSSQPGVLQPVAQSNAITRRDFLKTMGIVGIASLFAAGKAARSIQAAPAEYETLPSSSGSTTSQENTQTATVVVEVEEMEEVVEVQGIEEVEEVEAGLDTVGAVVLPSATPVVQASCSVRCAKGCSYPGRCRRYVDANDNNRCDLGECL